MLFKLFVPALEAVLRVELRGQQKTFNDCTMIDGDVA